MPAISERKGGFSLVETVIGVMILGGATAAVLSMMRTSVHQLSAQKMQAAASGFASGLMNRFLFEEPYDSVVDTGPTELVVDGIWFQYTLKTADIANTDIKYVFKKIPWHDPRHGAPGPGTGAEPAPLVMTDVKPLPDVTVLDKKFTSAGSILKDLLLTVKWHAPGESYPDDQHSTDENCLKLISRKARLE